MEETQRFKRLFKPVGIGEIELKNRIVMLPMENNYASKDGFVTERLKTYYKERARDVSLILIQIACVESRQGKGYVHQLCIDNDEMIPGLNDLARAIHEEGAKVFIQLHHAGANAIGDQPVAASPIQMTPGKPMPRALSLSEIDEMTAQYALAAERAKEAGFDGVEVVASGNYLVWNFLAPTWNKREDEFGRRLEGRAKLFLGIIKAIKAKVGKSYPVTCRLAIKEYDAEVGVTVSETQQVARWAVNAGLDGITATAIGGDSVAPSNPGALIPLASAMKQAVSVPVTAAAGMDLEIGGKAVEEGNADLVGIGRRFLADPEYVTKAVSGRIVDINPCIACKMCIDTSLLKNQPLRCAVNPACGREEEYKLNHTEKPKKVVVIGGGPGGMKAAIIAARRGHEVILFEKAHRLGGQLIPAALPPGKNKIQNLIDHLSTQLVKHSVEIRLGTAVEGELIESLKADVVVIATGKKDYVPEITGIENANVARAEDVLIGDAVVGIDVAVIGGDLVGCETAEFIADKGMNVTIVETLERLLSKTSPVKSVRLLKRLRDKGVTTLTGVKKEKFRDYCLFVTMGDGNEVPIPVDTIVYAAGGTPNNTLFYELKDRFPEIYCAGDCTEPRDIASAIEEGFNIGRSI